MNAFINSMETILEGHGYKMTSTRTSILRTLFEKRDKHMTIIEIRDSLHSKDSKVGMATVYRNIKLFEKLDIISKFNLGNDNTRYELNINKHRHGHFICIKCGKIQEVESKDINYLIPSKTENKIITYELLVKGVCKECLEK